MDNLMMAYIQTETCSCILYYISLLTVILLWSWLYVYIDIYTLQLCIIDLTQRGWHTLRFNMRIMYVYMKFFTEVCNRPSNSHQAHLPILLTIFHTKSVVILARWCVSKIIFFFGAQYLLFLAQIAISTVTFRVMTNCINPYRTNVENRVSS